MTHLDIEEAGVIKVVTNSRIDITEGMEEVDMCHLKGNGEWKEKKKENLV